ncbi:MAG: TetR/AcrR family transcriptional regulator [Sphingomonadales bacterium]|nr:TetR/AcrR family transcriptional regulator [Sphingomonadales bacterium]
MNAVSPPVPSRRGRPTAARVTAIDRAIVETARAMFLADGYDAVAMEQVAATAEISKGTLYARYPSKEALFTAVIDASVREWSEEASQQDHLLSDDIAQRLAHHARTIAASLRKPDVIGLQRLILSVRSRFPELAQAMHEKGYAYIVGVITDDIVAAAERDRQPARDPRAIAQMLVAGISGYQMEHDAEPDSAESLAAFAQRLVEIVVAARTAW